MKRRLLTIYVELRARPYKLAFKYLEFEENVTVIEIRRYFSYGKFARGLLEILSADDPSFLAKVCEIDGRNVRASSHRKRRYVAERQDLLGANALSLRVHHSKSVSDHWVATDIGRVETLSIASAAAEVKGAKRLAWSQFKV